MKKKDKWIVVKVTNEELETIKVKSNKVGLSITEYLRMLVLKANEQNRKTYHFADEEMCKHKQYLGKRVKRGLFKSSTGKILNADENGAIGILLKLKVADEKFKHLIISRGDVVSPVRLNV